MEIKGEGRSRSTNGLLTSRDGASNESPARPAPAASPPRSGTSGAPRGHPEAELKTFGDEDLVTAFYNGDHGAFAVGYERWKPDLQNVAWRIFHRAVDINTVNDAVHTSFLKLYKHHIPHCPSCSTDAPGGFVFVGCALSLLHTILHNVIVDMCRERKFLGLAEIGDVAAPDGPGVEHSILLAEVRQKIDALPAEDERRLMLSRWEGKTLVEIADAEHRAPSTIHKQQRKAMEHLRQSLGLDVKR
ncbi:MAG: sigma factor [Thermoanaerobaculia bacterium]|jgi:RNA polymerase sigma factor (sigma-70 family)|nr:sigma factor [Thermoanaerobaculia bacterium]